MAKIPKFKTLDEAAKFWDTHDFEDYVDDTERVTVAVTIPRRKMVLAIPIDLKVYEQIEKFAAKRRMRVEKLVSAWLKERAMAEARNSAHHPRQPKSKVM